DCYKAQGKFARAVADCEAALRLEPKNLAALNGLAWLLATCPDESVRDGERAVELARRACELSDWKDPGCLDTLAGGYAEAGDLARAVEYERLALEFPEYTKRFGDACRRRLKLYEESRPFRE